MKKKIIVLLVCVIGLFVLVGCGSSGDGKSSDSANKAPEINIEDIDWKVDTEVIKGERAVAVTFTNNTKYTIAGFRVDFAKKEDMSESDYLKALNGLKDQGWKESEIKENTDFIADSSKFVEAGKTSSPIVLQVGNFSYFTSMDEYEAIEADIISFGVIAGDKIYPIIYDCKNEKFTDSSEEAKDLYSWSDSELAKQLPKPECECVVITYDSDSLFQFDMYGTSKEYYKEYLSKCKDSGFTKDANNIDEYYSAKNKEGIELSIDYIDSEDNITVSVCN